MTDTIFVITHKEYEMPRDELYSPLLVGASFNASSYLPGMADMFDNTGDNISEKNKTYCELSGLYWIWKNDTSRRVGIVHYRRYFASKKSRSLFNNEKNLIQAEEINQLLNCNDILLPRKRHYFIESNYSQYAHAHNAADLDETRRVIGELYPEYLSDFDLILKRRSGHRYNMFITHRELLESYCEWLFDILFELEQRIDISNYDDYNRRVFGFISERLLDVWIHHNNLTYCELDVIHTEPVNWPKKIAKFIKRKIKGSRIENQSK